MSNQNTPHKKRLSFLALKEKERRTKKAFALACRTMQTLTGHSWKKIQEDMMGVVDTEQVCRVCGCTHHNACPGGCYWVEPDLCSACAKEGEEDD